MSRTKANGDTSHWHAGAVRSAQLAAYVTKAEYSQPTISAGSAAVPSLGAGASTVVAVTLRVSMGSTGYQAVPALTGSTQLLGSLSITGPATIVSGTVVNVPVQNTGLLTLAGATVLVIALKD